MLSSPGHASNDHTLPVGEGAGGGGEDDVIVDAAEEHQGPQGEDEETRERVHAGKKKARKLRQRMTNRYTSTTITTTVNIFIRLR